MASGNVPNKEWDLLANVIKKYNDDANRLFEISENDALGYFDKDDVKKVKSRIFINKNIDVTNTLNKKINETNNTNVILSNSRKTNKIIEGVIFTKAIIVLEADVVHLKMPGEKKFVQHAIKSDTLDYINQLLIANSLGTVTMTNITTYLNNKAKKYIK